MSSPLRLDLHVHSRHSPDGTMSLEQLVSAVTPAGLSGFALTDHNTVAGHAELARLTQRHPELLLVPGAEVSTREGHLLLYGVGEVPPARRPFAETVAWAERQGGVAVPAHPFRWPHGVGRRLAEAAVVPALETINGHSSPRANRLARHVAADRGLGTTGGSDAHLRRDLGRAYTEFLEDVRTLDELLEALRGGRTTAAGTDAGPLTRVRTQLRSASLRLARGLRPI